MDAEEPTYPMVFDSPKNASVCVDAPTKKLLREMIIDSLNDDNGANILVYNKMVVVCSIIGCEDIINCVNFIANRVYLTCENAERLRKI